MTLPTKWIGPRICPQPCEWLAKLQAIVDELPKTKDGVAVVTGMQLWTFRGYDRWPCGVGVHHDLRADGTFKTYKNSSRTTHLCYSTREAAEAARKGQADG